MDNQQLNLDDHQLCQQQAPVRWSRPLHQMLATEEALVSKSKVALVRCTLPRHPDSPLKPLARAKPSALDTYAINSIILQFSGRCACISKPHSINRYLCQVRGTFLLVFTLIPIISY